MSEPDVAGEGQAWKTAGRALGSAGLLVVIASLGSKLLGFARDAVLARQFIPGPSTNAYFVASQVPLVLFAGVGVAITTVFIPMLSTLLANGGAGDAEAFAARVNGLVSLAVVALIVALEIGAGPAVSIMAHGFPEHSYERAVTVDMVRIMAPLILFYAWAGVVGGVLTVRGFFGPNAAMGIPQNLVIIAAIVIGGWHRQDIRWVAWGSLVGTLSTYLMQLPALRRARFHLRWRFDFGKDPRLALMARLVVPAALTALAQQLGIVVDKALGSGLGNALLSDLTYASRLQLLAYSILGLSITTVLYPSLAASAARADMSAFRRTFSRGLGLVNFVTVPITIGMCLLRAPLVRALFQHGKFTPGDTHQTAYALAFLTLGTLGYGWQDYLNRAFFALKDTRSPMLGGFIAVGVNVILDFVLVGHMKQGGLALGTAAGWSCAAIFLAIRLRRRMGLLGGRQLISSTLGMALSALAGFVPALLLYPKLVAALGGGRWFGDTLGLFMVICAATTIYVLGCALFRVREVGLAVAMARGALGRVAGAGTASQPDV